MGNRVELDEMGKRILDASRTELYLSMRFLGPALHSLGWIMDLSTAFVGTDAAMIRFNPNYLFQLYVNRLRFLTRTYLIRHPDQYDAAIISGTGHQAKPLVFAGNAAAGLMVKMKGPRADGQALNDMAFGSYCKKIPDPRTPFDWLSRDPAQVDKYIADPLCGFVAKVSLYRDMMQGVKFITNQQNINAMSKEQPIYFMSGQDDPVGDYGVGVDKAYKAFCRAGLKDVTIRLYPGGRHEMLNEINKADVYRDILNWLNSKLDKIA